MATTYVLITSTVTGSLTNTITFSSIPQTYTDLAIRWSARANTGGNTFDQLTFVLSSTGTSYSNLYFQGVQSSGITQGIFGSQTFVRINNGYQGSSSTANTWSNNEIYIPNYTVSNYHPIGWTNGIEQNSTEASLNLNAGLDYGTTPVSSITLTAQNNLAIGSSFYLYGIKNS